MQSSLESLGERRLQTFDFQTLEALFIETGTAEPNDAGNQKSLSFSYFLLVT